ncbi:MAG: hypothetical protein KDN22_16610 [Verrucomicrobiae bacterium]|nr:hypothetical protein [Verrucomicrobiae bacterium]
MALTEFENAMVEVAMDAMEAFIARKRPPVEVRGKVDLAFRIEDLRIEAELPGSTTADNPA